MTPGLSKTLYELYRENRDELIVLAERQLKVVRGLHMDHYANEGAGLGDQLADLQTRLRDEGFRVLVMGEFNAGKSTLLNAMLGEKILPAKRLPTTAVLTVVRHVEPEGKRVIVYPRHGEWDGGDNPFEIKVEDLPRYASIQHKEGTSERSPFEKVEIYWPLSICRNGVELVDSPGLNDPDSHDEITRSYASQVDAVVYCMHSERSRTRLDIDTLELLHTLGNRSILFVLTHYDRIEETAARNRTGESEAFRRSVIDELVPLTELGAAGIHFVDSLTGLDGRRRSDQDAVESSGIADLEQQLERYLVLNRGRIKLTRAILSIQHSNSQAMLDIDTRLRLSRVRLDELEDRFRKARAPLADLAEAGNNIAKRVQAGLHEVLSEITDATRLFMVELPLRIPKWVDAFEMPKTEWNPLKLRDWLNSIGKEHISHIKIKLTQATAEWASETLNPIVQRQVERVFKDVDRKTRDYAARLQGIREMIAVDRNSDIPVFATAEQAATVSRLAAATKNALAPNLIGPVAPSLGSGKLMLRTLAFEVAGIAFLAVVSLFTPVGMTALLTTAVMTAAGAVGWEFAIIGRVVRQKLIDSCQASLREPEQIETITGRIRQAIKNELDQLAETVRNAAKEDIDQLEFQVNSLLGDQQAGPEPIRKRQEFLASMREENTSIRRDWLNLAELAGLAEK